MEHARCLYLVLVCADGDSRQRWPVARGALKAYLSHACGLMECMLEGMALCAGQALLMLWLNPRISIAEFLTNLKNWTSSWITGAQVPTEKAKGYWASDGYFVPFSPEDQQVAKGIVAAFDSEGLPSDFAMHRIDNEGTSECEVGVWHHVLLVASRERLLIRTKYRMLLAEIAKAEAEKMGTSVMACFAMRNHAHMLVCLPATNSTDGFLNALRPRLMEALHANLHFRKFEGWDETYLVHTVAHHRLKDEEYNILNQDSIHRRFVIPTECTRMQYLGFKIIPAVY